MYTVTFYSFKGGVGRTMAMANVGLSLAQAGRRVLLVDFDLEAPGLDTFDLLRPAEPTPGLVDFVTEYRKTHAAPDVTNFVYEPSHPNLAANIWVMPTGKQDADYGRRLSAIDWAKLYAEEDGYLLFEDLKQQWSHSLRPDYVLVDSRTGHTDVGGICTRQLPDAVALLFFPNEQNRRGLEVVVGDVTRESQDSGRSIQMYSIASNVPDLDDEDSILSKELSKFARVMERIPDATLHHYDSLVLLQQHVFTIERPRTKLAREYEHLAKIITGSNLEDRTVAAEFLDTVARGVSGPRKPEVLDERLKTIRRLYSQDGAVLYALGQAHRSLGRGKEANQLFAEAAQFGFLSEENLAEEASKEYAAGESERARQLVRRALELPTKHVFPVAEILSIVVTNDVDFLPEVLQALDAKNIELEDRLYLARRLQTSRKALVAAVEFLRPLISTDHPLRAAIRSELSLCLIGQRRFEDAESLILSAGQSSSELDIQDSFNYAMAVWGKNKTIPKELFLRVVAVDLEARKHGGADYLQCLAIANWAIGRSEVASELSRKSREVLGNTESEFSAWRYLGVDKDEFLRDLDSLDAMIATGQGRPMILNDHD